MGVTYLLYLMGATGQLRRLRRTSAVRLWLAPICGADVRFLHQGLLRPVPQR